MPRSLGARQLPSRRCGCDRCRTVYPTPERKPTKACTGNWQARWYKPDGTRDQATRAKKDDALAVRNAALAAIEAGTWTDPKRGLVQLAEWRKEWRKGRNVEAHTSHSDDALWKARVKDKWGKMPLRSIGHQNVQIWAVELEKAGLARDTVISYVENLGKLTAAAKRDGRILVDPCEDIVFSPERGRPSAPDKPPTVDEVNLICSHIKGAGHGRKRIDIYSRIPQVIKETGMRPEECFGLLPDCIDLEAGWIDVYRVLENVGGVKKLRDYPKSDAGSRRVPLTGLAKRMFTEHFEIQPPVDGKPVFRTLRGAEVDRGLYYVRFFQAAAVAAGLHQEVMLPSGIRDHWPTLYSLRHLFGTRLENNGVPLSIIKMVMGHKRPKKQDVTWTYLHAPEDPGVYGPIVLAALEGDAPTGAGRALRLVG